MLLNEIATDIARDEENDINTHTFNSAASEKLASGTKQIRIDMTPDDEDEFEARTEMVKNSVSNFSGLPAHERATLELSARPPEYVTAIYAYTLKKNPGTVDDTLKVMRIMSAVKNRNSKEVMPKEEVQAYLDASVERILKLTGKYSQSMSKYGKNKRANDEGDRMHQIYRQFLAPYFTGKFNKNSVIVPLGSTSGLVGEFAEALSKKIHVDLDVVSGAFIKNHYPKLDWYNKGTKDSLDRKVLRTPKSYTDELERNPSMIADPTVQEWVRKLSTARSQLAAAIKAKAPVGEQKPLKEHVNLCLKNLSQSLTHYITASQAAVSATLKEIVACRKRYASLEACVKSTEYKKLRAKFKQEVAVIRAITLPTYDVGHFNDIKQELHTVSTYIAAQDSVADDIDEIVQNVNAMIAARVNDAPLQLQNRIDSNRAKFISSVSKLIDKAVNEPFKVHNYYANRDVNNGKALSAYMVLHDKLYDKLDGKNIILVDDNIGTGATVIDAVKSIYYAGISPRNIIVMAPHYLESGDKEEGTDSRAIAAAKRAYNTREAENTTVLRQPVSSADVKKHLSNLDQVNKLRNINKAGAERLKSKLGQ
jgi:phosphoribosylpyrophosphate synthetase